MGVRYAAVPGFPGYQVGTDGSVWTCRGRDKLTDDWRRLKEQKVRDYRFVVLCRGTGTRPKPRYVHHLVLETFVGPCPPGMEALHRNDVQYDNRLTNLKWGTHKQNCELRRRNGRDRFGEDRKHSKLTNALVIWMRDNPDGLALSERARRCGVSYQTAWDVVTGRTWRHILKNPIWHLASVCNSSVSGRAARAKQETNR